MGRRIPITAVSPVIEGGAYPAKSVVGEPVTVGATVFREGHDALGVNVVLRDPDRPARAVHPDATRRPGTDRYEADVDRPTRPARGPSRSKPGATRSKPGGTTR